ncbi:D-alanyl-D-alanine carboxypeptidase, partial [Psychrobacter sp. 1Y4]
RLPILTLLSAVMLVPTYAQAALPTAIQAALSRADLTESDISIIVTPIGDKNASRLPAPIQVIDSSDVDSQSMPTTPSNNTTTNMPTDKNSSSQKATQNNNNYAASNPDQQSALITIEKRTIEQHEQKIHDYTDDPYTYQSVESIPTVVPDEQSTPANDANNAVSTDKTSIKISFSPLLNHQPDVPRTP